MLRVLQKVSVFYASKFQAAAQAMKQSGKQPWVQKISKNQRNQLWALYKQATEGDVKQQMKQQMKQNDQLSKGQVAENRTQQTKDQVKSNISHDQEEYEAWSKYKGKSREQAESEYVKFAKNLLTKHKAEKYIKDF